MFVQLFNLLSFGVFLCISKSVDNYSLIQPPLSRSAIPRMMNATQRYQQQGDGIKFGKFYFFNFFKLEFETQSIVSLNNIEEKSSN